MDTMSSMSTTSGQVRHPAAAPGSQDAVLAADRISLTYPGTGKAQERLQVLDEVSFTIRRGEFVCIVGRSGCGKTSLLRIMGGLQAATSGQILVESQPVLKPRRDVAFVFQEHNLLPWKTVLSNIEWGAKQLGIPRETRHRNATRLLVVMGLERFAESMPAQLSGGMRQRVGIARALCTGPKVLLMDEPLGALDAVTREQRQTELLRILEDEGVTVVMVTHSIEEAITLGDQILLMSSRPGRISDMVEVNFPHPRAARLAEYRHQPLWLDTRERLWRHLGGGSDAE